MTSRRNASLWESIDWFSVVLYIILIVGGWFAICGATYSFDAQELIASGSRPMMQLIWMGTGLLIAFAVLMVSPRIFEEGAPIFYLLMLGLLLVTIIVAPDIKGSRSWLVVGPLRLQPAEFAKVATALVLGWQCNKYGFAIKSIKSYAILLTIVFTPILMILAQSETGSALVFLSLFLALYREGFSGLFMGLGLSAVVYFVSALVLDGTLWFGETTRADWLVVGNAIVAFTLAMLGVYGKRMGKAVGLFALASLVLHLVGWLVGVYLYPFDLSWVTLTVLIALLCYLVYLAIEQYASRYLLIVGFALGSIGFFFSTNYVFDEILEPHQQVRIKVALGIESDLRGKGYNVDQSKIAIGSGGLWGKGFLEGTQTKLNYVPEQDTDFILCTVGEEQGFVGTTLLLLLYGTLILRLAALAERQVNAFGRVYGYSVAAILLFHLFINVGMVLGLLPVIGIPLPFFSYGGSSLWGFSFLMFIFLGIDARRHNRHL